MDKNYLLRKKFQILLFDHIDVEVIERSFKIKEEMTFLIILKCARYYIVYPARHFHFPHTVSSSVFDIKFINISYVVKNIKTNLYVKK